MCISSLPLKTEQIIIQTENWIKSFIIKYNICPFAKQELNRGSIHYSVVKTAALEQCLNSVFTECQRLDKNPSIETTLIIYPLQFSQYNEYLDFLEMAELLLIGQNYEGVYQLASFHPDYCFEGENKLDPANYTNRSPYPMLHLIREASIELALKSFSHPELIPIRNIKLTRELGLEKIKRLLNNLERV